MARIERLHLVDNRNYQQQLAASLVECLGPEGAVRACQANGWDGVLCHVLPRPDTTSAPAEQANSAYRRW